VAMNNSSHMGRIVLFVGANHPADLAMWIEPFADQFKIGSQDKIPFDLRIGVMKFVTVEPDIVTARLEIITLIGGIEHDTTRDLWFPDIGVIAEYSCGG